MKNQNADELLESIFYYMNQLFEKRDFTSTIEILTNLGRTLVQSDRASFWFWDRKSHQYWTLAAVGNERIVVPENTGIVGVTMQENRPVVLNEPYEDSRFNPAVDMETGYRTKSILCIPVTSEHGEMLGAYQALNKQGEDGDCAFDEKDVKRLSLVAVFGAKTLESYLLHNKAFFDQLTGLKNRSGLYEAFHTRILSGQKKTYSIVMGDIDYFKKVNDTYGHNAGDTVLGQKSCKKMSDWMMRLFVGAARNLSCFCAEKIVSRQEKQRKRSALKCCGRSAFMKERRSG